MQCPTCKTNIWSPFERVGTGEPPPKPTGEVIRRRSYAVYFCDNCKTILIDPFEWVYAGDGDYDAIGWDSNDPPLIASKTIREWNDPTFNKTSFIKTLFAERDAAKANASVIDAPVNRGLYNKYTITKADGSPVDPDAQYLVLRLDTDENACLAVINYARNVNRENPVLADQLLGWVHDIIQEREKKMLG